MTSPVSHGAVPELELTLPWPDKRLSPNARVHWAVKAKAVKDARQRSFFAAYQAGIRRLRYAGRVGLTYTFHPPDKRARDLDNLIASTKAISDGISDALRIDDSRFVPTFSMGAPVNGGAVHVTVREA
jgi:crossover junction endodeoxyribonuclease RusA